MMPSCRASSWLATDHRLGIDEVPSAADRTCDQVRRPR
jgi:hypothetical protein